MRLPKRKEAATAAAAAAAAAAAGMRKVERDREIVTTRQEEYCRRKEAEVEERAQKLGHFGHDYISVFDTDFQ